MWLLLGDGVDPLPTWMIEYLDNNMDVWNWAIINQVAGWRLSVFTAGTN